MIGFTFKKILNPANPSRNSLQIIINNNGLGVFLVIVNRLFLKVKICFCGFEDFKLCPPK